MKAIRRVFSSESGWVGLRIAFALLILAAFTVLAAPPAWWAARGVTNGRDSDDYAPINQGQLKNLAAAAVAEFEEKLEGGAGDALKALAASWAAPSARRDDYAAVNVGQLKALARPFYDRLKAKGLATAYPWQGSTAAADDYALANIGQAKNLFAFRLSHFDVQEVPDWWVAEWDLAANGTFNSAAMAPGGLTYLQKFQYNLNPNVADTNGNGVDDATDIANGTDPTGGTENLTDPVPGKIPGAPRRPVLAITRLNREKVKLTWMPTIGSYLNSDQIYICRSTDDGPWTVVAGPLAAKTAEWKDSVPPDHRYLYTAVVVRTGNPSYAAEYVVDYYLDVTVEFRTTNDDDFPDGTLTASGFIPETWTADTPPAELTTWPLEGDSLTKKGVIRWEYRSGEGRESGKKLGGGAIGGIMHAPYYFFFGSIFECIANWPLKVDYHGLNLTEDDWVIFPDLFGWPAAHIRANLSHSQGIWRKDPGNFAENALKDHITYPSGMDDMSMPNALMIPSGASNTVTYYAGGSPPTGNYKSVTLSASSGFSSNSAGPLDTDEEQIYELTLSGTSTAATGTLTASRSLPLRRQLALVPLQAPQRKKKIVAYAVRLVDDAGAPVLEGRNQVIGQTDSNALLDTGINSIFGKQANVTFDVQTDATKSINYSHFTAAGTTQLVTKGDDDLWQQPFNDAVKNNGADFTLFFVAKIADNVRGRVNKVRGNWAVIDSTSPIDKRSIITADRVITATHELGHLLGLNHPFGAPKGSTNLRDNPTNMVDYPQFMDERLMDYHDGARLIRKEWELI